MMKGALTKLNSWGLRNLLLPVGDAFLGHPMMKRLRLLEQAQWWSREQIERERNRLLANVVATAYREVPFYQELFKMAGVKPAHILAPSDLRKLPVVTKAALRAGYPDKCCRSVRGVTYETCTSGSTGSNFRVREDHHTAGWYRASFLLALEWANWRIGDPHVQIGMTTKRDLPRRIKDAAFGCHYVSGFDLANEALDHCLNLLERKRIRHLWGYPGSLFCLARRALERGLNVQLTSVVTWGDQLHPHYRDVMERAFQICVHDTYGCGEGMQIAAQCGVGTHYHIHELDVVVEYLDDHDKPVRPGVPGRIVLTRLHAGPMPFLRYEVGDIGIAGTQSCCACGRNFAILQGIQGRNADYVITPSGNRLIVHFFTGILEHFREVESFQVIQDQPETMRLHIVPAAGYCEVVGQRIQDTLRNRGADLNIEVLTVAEIPLTSGGKRQFIVRKAGI